MAIFDHITSNPTAAERRPGERPRRRRLPSPAFAVSIVALLVAMSGAAAALPGKNTVNSGDVKANTLKTVDLKDGKAVTTDDVVDETLTGGDVAADSLAQNDLAPDAATASEIAANGVGSAEVAANAVGSAEIAPNAVDGAEIAPNAVESDEIANGQVRSSDLGPTTVRTETFTINAGSSGGAFVNCPAGETRISGGATVPAGNGRGLQSTWPNGANGWTSIIRNNTGADIEVTAYVLCLQG